MDHACILQHPHVRNRFSNHEIHNAYWLHEEPAQAMLNCKRTHSTQRRHALMLIRANNNVARCCLCGCVGDFIMSYRHNNEPRDVNHIDVFALTEHDVRMFTQDHILPRSLGGTGRVTNMRLMCNRCNTNRGNSITIEELDYVFENLSNHMSSNLGHRGKFEYFLKNEYPTYHLRYLAWAATLPDYHETYAKVGQSKPPKSGPIHLRPRAQHFNLIAMLCPIDI